MKPSVLIPGMSAQLSNIPTASGSSEFTLNTSTQVSCAVYHTEVKPRQEQPQRATIEVLIRPLNGKITHKTREFENMIRNCLEYAIQTSIYPRSLIRVVFQVMRRQSISSGSGTDNATSTDGHLLACLLNASMLALMNASVAIKSLLSACTFETLGHGYAFFVYERGDSSSNNNNNNITPLNQLVCSHVEGFLFVDETDKDEKLFDEYIKYGAKDISPHIFQFFREVLSSNSNLAIVSQQQ